MNQTPKKKTGNVNRVLYVVTVTMLFAIAVVIAITSAANKTKKPPKDTAGVSETEIETEMPRESEQSSGSEVKVPVTTDHRETKVPETTEKAPETSTEASVNDTEATEANAVPPKFTLPVLGILSKKHDTELQVYSATMNDYRVHSGIDIVTEEGAPVYAAAGGEISQIWNDPLMGKCISIKHGEGCYTVYKNLAPEIAAGIEVGEAVGEGQLIASVGGTAMTEIAEEPHLHFEITVAGKGIDPLEYFDESSLASLTIDASFES